MNNRLKKSLLLIVLFMSMLSVESFAHDIAVENADGVTIYYIYTNNNTELAVSYRGTSYSSYSNEYSGNIVIPESVSYNGNTYSVTSINGSAFRSCSTLTSVTIPNSVTNIGTHTFYGCSKLASVTIPNSVTSISERMFYNCSSLTSVTIPNSVTSIDTYAFYGCSGLTSVTIPNSVTTIGTYAFSSCSKLASVNIPNSVTSISERMFYNCSSLTSVTIPNSVTSIDTYAFYGCSKLTSVTIPNSVTTIGTYAFSSCSSLISVEVEMESPLSISSSTFSNRTNATLYVPKGSKAAYKAASYWKDFKYIVDEIITFADANVKAVCVQNWDTNGDGEISTDEAAAVTDLGTAFRNNTTITSFDELVFFTGLTTIGIRAFYNCSSLTSLEIPNTVTSIGDYAFNGCGRLTSVTIPNSVTSIGKLTFRYCRSLISVTIPNSVTSIGVQAFNGCTGLTSASLSNSMTSTGDGTFWDCTSLTSVTIPSSVTCIERTAFYNCSSLTSLEIPNTVTSIGDYAFRGCSGLTSVTIPAPVTSIGDYAFDGCRGLTSIIVESGNTVYDSRGDCNAIISTADNILILGCKNTVIPHSVTSIGNNAFRGCNGLASVTIPYSVTNIGDYAFYGCSSLTTVIAENPSPVSLASENTFSNRRNATLYVPRNSRLAYSSDDVWKDFKYITFFPNPDVNRDGRVTIADATEIVNFILGKPSKGFIERIADIYEDGRITIADATAIVNLILYPKELDESDGVGVDATHDNYNHSSWYEGDDNVTIGRENYEPGNWGGQ